ncbi:hypothetical protein MNBD_UNCLBAC01-2138 [hydrothermal vent metagenome]|uniref:Fimbrial assembly protein (PilN) n=1 Tax=hydrothermal vent metagenome TaxID=652676 RepID=A0A3B1D2M2_9ZZZZ
MKKGYLGLEVTASKIRYVFATKKGRGFCVHKAGVVDYRLDNIEENGFSMAVYDIFQKEGISPKKIFLSISRQNTIIRQVTLPKMKPSELTEIIQSEIEKIPAFFEKEYEYIYHKYSNSVKQKNKIIFAAAHKDLLTYYFKEINKCGAVFNHCEITPLNLHGVLCGDQANNGVQAVLVVHDHISYFMIYKNNEYKMFYKVSIGLDDIYSKENQTFHETFFANLTNELQRVLQAYLMENKRDAINEMFLIWDQAKGPSLAENINKKLGTEVKVPSLSDFCKNLSLEKDLDNPIYMLACVPIFYHCKKIKEHFSLQHFFKFFRMKRYLVKAILLTMIFMLMLWSAAGVFNYTVYTQKAQLVKETTATTEKTAQLRESSKELYEIRDAYVHMRQGLLAQATFVKLLNRVSWAQVLSAVSKELPEDVSLTSFQFNESQNVSFDGEALDVETIAQLIRQVDDSSLLNGGKFNSLREKIDRKEEEEFKFFKFGISAQLKKEAMGTVNDEEIQ